MESAGLKKVINASVRLCIVVFAVCERQALIVVFAGTFAR